MAEENEAGLVLTPKGLLSVLGLADNRVKQIIDALELHMRRRGTVMAPDDVQGLAFKGNYILNSRKGHK